jgi:hypothetical protein
MSSQPSNPANHLKFQTYMRYARVESILQCEQRFRDVLESPTKYIVAKPNGGSATFSSLTHAVVEHLAKAEKDPHKVPKIEVVRAAIVFYKQVRQPDPNGLDPEPEPKIQNGVLLNGHSEQPDLMNTNNDPRDYIAQKKESTAAALKDAEATVDRLRLEYAQWKAALTAMDAAKNAMQAPPATPTPPTPPPAPASAPASAPAPAPKLESPKSSTVSSRIAAALSAVSVAPITAPKVETPPPEKRDANHLEVKIDDLVNVLDNLNYKVNKPGLRAGFCRLAALAFDHVLKDGEKNMLTAALYNKAGIGYLSSVFVLEFMAHAPSRLRVVERRGRHYGAAPLANTIREMQPEARQAYLGRLLGQYGKALGCAVIPKGAVRSAGDMRRRARESAAHAY